MGTGVVIINAGWNVHAPPSPHQRAERGLLRYSYSAVTPPGASFPLRWRSLGGPDGAWLVSVSISVSISRAGARFRRCPPPPSPAGRTLTYSGRTRFWRRYFCLGQIRLAEGSGFFWVRLECESGVLVLAGSGGPNGVGVLGGRGAPPHWEQNLPGF